MANYGNPERERALPARKSASAESATADTGVQSHPLLTLQRQVGNAQIARMLAQRAPTDEEEAVGTETEEAPSSSSSSSSSSSASTSSATPTSKEEDKIQAKHLQRHASEDDLQASPEVGLEGGPVSDQIAQRIDTQRGSGSPLDGSTRDSMESSFGTSFDGVRVHTDTESAKLNQSISAKAFTTGNDIFLGQGVSTGDHSLMAHELTHVVQQRSMPGGGKMEVGPAGDSYEQQADATAAAVTSGSATTQRKPDEQH